MLTFEESQAMLAALDVGARASRTEHVDLREALGRVLAEDVAIDRDQPGFDRATMDGFAVVPSGETQRFDVIATVTAGTEHDGTLAPGQCVRIMTGAPAPSGTTVVPIERTSYEEGAASVELDHVPEPGRNIAWRGEDARVGDVLVRAGTRLAPAHLSVAAMAGATKVAVHQRPAVAVVTTGDEVGAAGAAGIRDSNGPLLDGLLTSIGATVTRHHAKDDEYELRAALEAAASAADVVVTTGGVSMGTRDLVPTMLADLGFETVFHKVKVQPGKPVLVASRGDGAVFVGLPGNPVSVLATAHLFLFPVLDHYVGRSNDGARPSGWLDVTMASEFTNSGPRHMFLPATLDAGGVRPVAWNGSGDLIAAAAADGLVSLPSGETLSVGAKTRFLPYAGHVLTERAILPPRG